MKPLRSLTNALCDFAEETFNDLSSWPHWALVCLLGGVLEWVLTGDCSWAVGALFYPLILYFMVFTLFLPFVVQKVCRDYRWWRSKP